MIKLCVVCSKQLTSRQKKYCSDTCLRECRRERDRKRYHERRVPRFCVICNKPLSGKRKKTCSDACFKEWQKEYCLNNREKIRERGHRYKQNNPEKVKEQNRRSRQRNEEYYREYRRNNRERINEYGREYYQNNRQQKFCVVCGNPLPRLHSKLCSNRECKRVWVNAQGRKKFNSRENKLCIICGKPLTGNQQKTCSVECRVMWKRKYQDEYRLNHQEEKAEYSREYRLNNREKIEKWYWDNQKYLKEYRRKRGPKYYQMNKERINKRTRKNYLLSRGLPEDWDLSRESSIETIMKRWLQESDIEFVQQYYINLENSSRTHVDFFIPEANVCLYCDGDYWHGPKRPDAQERDVRNNKALVGMGYSVVRMTETEILEGNRPWWIGELISAKW